MFLKYESVQVWICPACMKEKKYLVFKLNTSESRNNLEAFFGIFSIGDLKKKHIVAEIFLRYIYLPWLRRNYDYQN